MAKMTIPKLARKISKREGLKEEVDIAQISELLRVLAQLFAEEHDKNSDEAWACFRDYALKFTKQCKKN